VHKFLEATAGQFMRRSVKTVARDTTMRELQGMFEKDDFNCYPVREGDDAVGVVSNFDFLKCFAFNPAAWCRPMTTCCREPSPMS
jgi:predicted transcriptional regulator